MAKQLADPLFCDNIGNTSDLLHCCYPDDQDAQVCRTNFNNPKVHTFSDVCKSGNCFTECQQKSFIYASILADDPTQGNGAAPIQRYLTCANLPNMAGYYSQKVLEPDILSQVEKYIPLQATDEARKNVTRAVTECLTETCSNARDRTNCYPKCSSVNLLLNSTTPNVRGLDACLTSLCAGKYHSLPFADADVVGIGVFASYIMQCIFVVILWFGLTIFKMHKRKRGERNSKLIGMTDLSRTQTHSPDPRNTSSKEERTSQQNFEDFLVHFHKAQCYFSGAIQIASLSQGIFDTDMLNTFLLIPLATNGVLPVVFAYVLLLHCHKASMDVTLLTTVCWILASLVYWVLYSHVIPINRELKDERRKYRAYEQFMYKLSALPACGGYSALAACPTPVNFGRDAIKTASRNLSVLTPIIWTFSTICILVALGEELKRWYVNRNRGRRYGAVSRSSRTEANGNTEDSAPLHTAPLSQGQPSHSPSGSSYHSVFTSTVIYWVITLCFLAGIGMQVSLLSVARSLNMTNRKQWSFGQIVAVTIWAPPLLEYLSNELKRLMPARFGDEQTPTQRTNNAAQP